MSHGIRKGTGGLADLTMGTAIVMVHVVLADRARRRSTPRLRA